MAAFDGLALPIAVELNITSPAIPAEMVNALRAVRELLDVRLQWLELAAAAVSTEVLRDTGR